LIRRWQEDSMLRTETGVAVLLVAGLACGGGLRVDAGNTDAARAEVGGDSGSRDVGAVGGDRGTPIIGGDSGSGGRATGDGATGPPMASRRHHSATLLQDGRVLVAGGETDDNNYVRLSSVELYDPAGGTFIAGGDMTVVRESHTAVLLESGKVLILGGWSAGTVPVASAELYDPAAGTFTATGSMTLPRTMAAAIPLPSGKVLVLGGLTGASMPVASAELYDPATGTFTATGGMSMTRLGFTATGLADGRVLVAGGDSYGAGNSDPTRAEVYDEGLGAFTAGGSMTTRRTGHSATLLSDGKVLLAGGRCLASAELFDPATTTFILTGKMATDRSGHLAIRLASGRVLVVGGSGSGGGMGEFGCGLPEDSLEIYDPLVGTFGPSHGLVHPSMDSRTATLLLDGRVLLVGGQQAAELYEE
jgi:hypothetical protein